MTAGLICLPSPPSPEGKPHKILWTQHELVACSAIDPVASHAGYVNLCEHTTVQWTLSYGESVYDLLMEIDEIPLSNRCQRTSFSAS